MDKNTEIAYRVTRKERKNWGTINPVTKVIPNKKKNRKEKHKGQILKDYES